LLHTHKKTNTIESEILSKEQFSNLQNTLEELKVKIDTISKKPQEVFVDNQEFLFLMKISKRTAQTWRDEGKISFSQVGNKIYYKMADVEELLNKHYVKALKNR
jgi:hypothetical protein